MKRSAAVLICLFASGCYEQIYNALVDKADTSPGGAITTTLGAAQVGDTTGLAKSSSSTSMNISGTSKDATLVLSMTAGIDTLGVEARDALGAAGGTATLVIDGVTASAIQLHYLGSTCASKTGQIDLTADANLDLTGTFMADGVDSVTNADCALTGTITAIPQSR